MNKSVKQRRKHSNVWANVRSACGGAAVAGVSLWVTATAAHAAAGKPKPAPQQMCDGLATAQAWVAGIAVTAAVIGLVLIGIGMFFSHRHENGSSLFAKVGYWALGATFVGAATAIAGVFISGSLNCQ